MEGDARRISYQALGKGVPVRASGGEVVLNLPAEEAERLGWPQAPEAYHADPSEHAGGSLHDWFGRTFGHGHWK